MSRAVPASLETSRLHLRPWREDDAPALQPILEANRAHLGPWIPRHVSEPAPVPELAARLQGFADAFAADHVWRYAMVARDDATLLGEVGLFPRNVATRVPFAEVDRVEIGYWLRADRTGQGLVTEAADAMLGVVRALPSLAHAEIRCDARNAPSGAVPRRLGFTLVETIEVRSAVPVEVPVLLQCWALPLR